MGWYLAIVVIAQREIGFQGTISKFSDIGGVPATQPLFVVAGCSLAVHPPQGSGRACGWSWQTHTSSQEIAALFTARHTYVWCSDLFWPQKRIPRQCFIFKHTTGDKICLLEECSTRPALQQADASTCIHILTIAHHLLFGRVNVRAEPLRERPKRKGGEFSGYAKICDSPLSLDSCTFW